MPELPQHIEELFNKEFWDSNLNRVSVHDRDPDDIKSFIATVLEEAYKAIEVEEMEDEYHHGLECRGYRNQIYLKGDSLGGHCTCIPIKDKDFSEYNSALSLIEKKKSEFLNK